jgi:hypothetical protein
MMAVAYTFASDEHKAVAFIPSGRAVQPALTAGCGGSDITTTEIDQIKRQMDEFLSRRYSTKQYLSQIRVT